VTSPAPGTAVLEPVAAKLAQRLSLGTRGTEGMRGVASEGHPVGLQGRGSAAGSLLLREVASGQVSFVVSS